jgi:predicted DNA-binding protein
MKDVKMKNKRVAFELPNDLHNKLKKLCKENNQGVSEYLRGLIKQEYNNTVASPMTGDTVLEVLKQIKALIEKHTRIREKMED